MSDAVAPSQTQESGAYARLRAAILDFGLAPGAAVSERGLEVVAGASRTPVRAALHRLETEGLVRREPRGWRIAPIDLDELGAVMEYREAIEVAVVALAAERASDEQLQALRELAGHEASDPDAGLREGGDFHLALARAAGNPFLIVGLGETLTRLSRTRRLEAATPESRAGAQAEHLAIAEAVAARDAARARDLVVAHGRGTRDRLLALLAVERGGLAGATGAVSGGGARAAAEPIG
ncbi:GntR family transcriptional regulator [Agromyces seonyuensis]|uniref:FCD domain-containing protein n=1 Tax=Agromyces seonyuensis TaxID=2662446 RepID=A0A6I4NVA0_9MICO|nr:GntR family transcriptional regulator [Agromyces seonyuensis]MWB97002.1 FCD domain-containing protein [Agromyces seonyuensis]